MRTYLHFWINFGGNNNSNERENSKDYLAIG